MRAILSIVIATALGLGAVVLSGCYDESYEHNWGPTRQTHEEHEFDYGPKHEVCDSYGNHCMVCDADNDYCRRTSSGRWSAYSQGY